MLYYTKTAQQALKDLGVSKNGLAVSEAAERLQLYGPNAIKVTGEPLWRKLIEPFANVFMLVLSVAAIISFTQGAYLDGTIIAVIMMASAVIYYIQRFSTERIIRSLQKRHAHTATVFRDNKSVQIDVSQLVPGDVISLGEGEKVPADARLLEADSLHVDESQLTGESQPMSKQIDKLPTNKEIYEQSNMLFQGSFVTSGEATAIIVATGNNTQFGQLAALATNSKTESPVQVKINKLLSQIIAVVTALALVAFGLSMLRGMELSESIRFVMALSVSAVPESLPVAISVILVLGMRRMAAKKALVRNMAAIETIGVITTIATDKTGTLTKNELTVQEVWQLHPADTHFIDVLGKAVNHRGEKMHDPLDSAFHAYAREHGGAKLHHEPAESFPFTQDLAISGNLWHHGDTYELAVKGAPENITVRCDLTESEQEKITAQLHRLTAQGYRVVAVAYLQLKHRLTDLNQLTSRDKLQFCGLVADADILYPEATKAIQTALRAGVSVRMITGDHFETAFHIGRQLGMVKSRDRVS